MYYERLYWFLAIAKPMLAIGIIVAITLGCLIYGEERKQMDFNDDGPFDPWGGEQWHLDDEDGDRILIGQEPPQQFDTFAERNGDR